jgi:hypothetical protein
MCVVPQRYASTHVLWPSTKDTHLYLLPSTIYDKDICLVDKDSHLVALQAPSGDFDIDDSLPVCNCRHCSLWASIRQRVPSHGKEVFV